MLDHGLDPPILGTDTGYFQVTFPGPGDNVERLRVPDSRLKVTPSVETQLAEFGITRPVMAKNFRKLVQLGLVEQVGSGRSTRYRLMGLTES